MDAMNAVRAPVLSDDGTTREEVRETGHDGDATREKKTRRTTNGWT